MPEARTQVIRIELLDLDPENPRHERAADQTATIRALLEKSGPEKLLRLAEDISREGPNPAELLIVMPSAPESGRFLVLEGNRRVACLKALRDPTVLDLSGRHGLRRQFERASKQAEGRMPDSLECLVVQSRDEATHWIQLRHTGEREGAGIVKWSTAASARFTNGQNWIALAVVDFLREKGNLDAAKRRALEGMPLTNLARLVNDPDVRAALGIVPRGGRVAGTAREDDVIKCLTKIAMDVADKSITVNRIRSKEDRTNYVGELIASGAIPRVTAHAVESWDISPSAPVRPTRGRPHTVKRQKLIPSTLILRITEKRIRAMFDELKKLDADKLPNSAAVLLRVFLELSLDSYIDVHALKVSTERGKLSAKLTIVERALTVAKALSPGEAQAVRTATGGRGGLFTIDTLHAYVHNFRVFPGGEILRETWDQMEPLFKALWP